MYLHVNVNRLTVICWNKLKVMVPVLQTVLMRSGYLWTEPLCHSQVPSGPALTTWPSRFFTYTAPFRPYLPNTTEKKP